MSYLKTRFKERLNLIYALRDDAKKHIEKAQEILKDFKETENEGLLKEFKKEEFINNMKFMEIDRNLPILVELYNLAILDGVDLELTEEEKKVMETTKERFVPFFILDKGDIKFANPDVEGSIMNELDNPSETDLAAIKNILNGSKG